MYMIHGYNKHTYIRQFDAMNSKAECMLCLAKFSGRIDIENHTKFHKHKEAVSAKVTSQKLLSFKKQIFDQECESGELAT